METGSQLREERGSVTSVFNGAIEATNLAKEKSQESRLQRLFLALSALSSQ